MTVTSADRPIQFPCHCGHPFTVPADRAGSTIQCPKCGLLCDIPMLSELENLSDDGTLLLKPAPIKPEPSRIAAVDRHFGPSRTDRNGNEIDLRNTHDDLANIGAAPEEGQIPAGRKDAKPAKPKYDPVTGELIRPLQLANKPQAEEAKNIPVAARALTYAAGDASHIITLGRIFIQLFMPVNIVVILFIFAFYFCFQLFGLFGMYLFAAAGLIPTLFNIPLAMQMMAHYVNVLEDTGPNTFDELPRPLRNLSFNDDFFRPFCNMTLSLCYCFLPAVFSFILLPGKFAALGVLPLALGFLFFPAVLLTTTAGGSLFNLRPDRLAGMIRIAGGQYTLSFLLWLIGLPLLTESLFSVLLIPASFRDEHEWIYLFNKPIIAMPLLFVTIVLLHFASWHLGMIYRWFHQEFPWVLQHHVSARREAEAKKAAEIRAMRRKPRYVDQARK